MNFCNPIICILDIMITMKKRDMDASLIIIIIKGIKWVI